MRSVSQVRRIRRPLAALIALLVALAVGYVLKAAGSSDNPAPTTSHEVALSSLPTQAATTVHLIEHGGPFPYPGHDGVTFHNFEHRLPAEDDGYYREYTVPTPGSPDRGARRMITGRDGEFYYTGNHYETFQRVDVSR